MAIRLATVSPGTAFEWMLPHRWALGTTFERALWSRNGALGPSHPQRIAFLAAGTERAS